MFEYENLIQIKFNDYVCIHYIDYLFGEKFFNVEIYKDNKCLRHATVEKFLNEDELCNYLKEYLNEKI